MSRESTTAAAPSHPQASSSSSSSSQTHHTEQSTNTQEHQNNFVDEDDADFVLVVNRKKNHHVQQQTPASSDSYNRKHRQSYDHHTDDERSQTSYQGRRRKYRDRGGGGGEQKEKGFGRRRGSHKHHDKENINKTANSTAASSQQNQQQTLPTSPPPPLTVQQPQLQTPSGRSFSLVVMGGSTSAPLSPLQKSTQIEAPVVLPQQQQQQQISSSPLDQSKQNDQQQEPPPVRLTNRQILMVMKPKQEPGPSTTSSIPDTSSITSEETLDSIDRKTSADAESNAGSSVNSVPVVEYVDAPAPKINPWVVNRNAAQVITGQPGNVALSTGFPSVSESFTATDAPLSPPQKQPLTEQLPPSQIKPTTPQQKTRRQNSQGEVVKPPATSPTSFSEAVTSPKQKQDAAAPVKSELPKKPEQQLPSSPPPPPLQQQQEHPSVYIREMSNGFRPGRGRGSYSASASAGRKIPSRSSVLMKVASSDRSEDWPTLGEAGTVARAQKLSSSGDEESTGETPHKNEEDVVDSHANKQLPIKSNDAPSKSPPPPQDRQESVQKPKLSSPPPPREQKEQSPQNQPETTSSSDNEDDINSSGKQRKGSKQKWVPLDMTAPQQGGGGTGTENPPPEHKKSGKPKHNKYYSNYHGGGYPRAKGKENMAINGVNDYSDYNAHGHSYNQGRYSNPRGGPHNNPHHRSNPQMNSGRGGSNNSSRARRHHPNHHRSSSTLSLNNHSMMNGSHPPTHHHANYDIITSPTQPPPDYQDFTTLTPMYPAVSDFIMPYVTNGYFPTPYTPPTGVIVEQGTDVVGAVPIVVTQAQPTAVAVTTQAVPFPNGELPVLTDLVRTQIEYYFSDENLAKDFYLRRKMDPEGYLPVHILATFPRVQQMTHDYSAVLTAIQSSETLELKPDMSGVRPSVNPEKWPILDRSTPQHHQQQTLVPSSTTSSSESIPSKKCINNNNTPGGGGVETLNPNVPEFVPKSKVALF